MNTKEQAESKLREFSEITGRLRAKVGEVIVGQDEVIGQVLTCLFSSSHALLEGVPGLGKTLLIRTLAEVTGQPFSRIQFTPDLMPADILGSTVIQNGANGERRFDFKPGPIFSPIVLADEINRATPKTQSALLEAMQEGRVSVAGTTRDLPRPYFVLATQNPLEMEGTYPLPEAQLDRFLMKLLVPFPSAEDLLQILDRTTFARRESPAPCVTKEQILSLQDTVRQVPAPANVLAYVVKLLRSTHPNLEPTTDRIRRFVSHGASPRGAQALLLSAKVRALLHGRAMPTRADVDQVAKPTLRHRILLNFEGEAEGIQTDDLIAELVASLAE